MTLQCLMCSTGKSKEQLCKENEKLQGCQPKVCCKAMTLQCLMCSSGKSKEELCKANPKLSGCDESSEEPSESQEDVDCPDDKYVNTSMKVKKADSKKISLVLK